MQTASPPETIAFRNRQLFLPSKWGTLVIEAWPRPGAWTYRDEREIRMPCSLSTSVDYWLRRYNEDIDGTNKVESRRALRITLRRSGYTPSWTIPVKSEDRASTRPFFDFIQQIPKELRTTLARYSSQHWDMLRLAAQNQAFTELMKINPGVAFCFSAHTELRPCTAKQPLREVARMVNRKQREILGWLGFPETEHAVRIVRKIPPCACYTAHMKKLRSLLNGSLLPKYISHFDRINPNWLFIFERNKGFSWTTPKFRRQAISSFTHQDNFNIHVAFNDTLQMAETLRIEKPIRFKSVEHLLEIHADWIDQLQRKEDLRFSDQEFPQPPLPGNDCVVPVDSHELLRQEGRLQHHCVAAYLQEICEGIAYVYRVLAPERATLSLRREGETWFLDQLAAACNKPVKLETKKTVTDWLNMAQNRKDANI